MSNVKFSVSWNAEKNLYNALGSLQQNAQFVDMTLAADGCYVKVHQLVLALASPYLRELISSVQCPHPVIFLNHISYNTLCSLLEYIYSGEVMVSAHELDQLIEAGKALHIKGIQDMTIEHTTLEPGAIPETIVDREPHNYEEVMQKADGTQITEDCGDNLADDGEYEGISKKEYSTFQDTALSEYDMSEETLLDQSVEEHLVEREGDGTMLADGKEGENETGYEDAEQVQPSVAADKCMQYTVSTQGSLQMILNRFIYFLKYTTQDNYRQWRCVDYVTKTKCPAYVIAKGTHVLKRVAAHKHTYHDKKIIKKLKAKVVFEELAAAEGKMKVKKSQKKKQIQDSIDIDNEEHDMEQ